MWVVETKNGKYKFSERYMDPLTGKDKYICVTLSKKTAAARKEAQQILARRIEKATSGTTNKRSYSLSEVIAAYRAYQEKTVKESTYTRNYHTCNSLMAILGKDTLIERITPKYLKDRFLASGKSFGTLNEYLARFRALVRWAFANDYVTDIAFLAKIQNFKDVPHKIKIADKYLENDELKKLLSNMQIERWRLVVKFMTQSGLRFGEVVALDKSDIDFDQKVIHVTKSYDSNNRVITDIKSVCSIRDVYMQPQLEKLCREINAFMLQDSLIHGRKRSSIFLSSKDGARLRYFSFNKYLKENAIATIGRPVTTHALRHTHASLLLEKDVDIETISRRLGHENSKITREIYLHVTKKLQKKDNEQLTKIII